MTQEEELNLYKDMYLKNSEGILSVYKLKDEFKDFKTVMLCHIESDKARDEKMTNLIKVITVDNGKKSVLTRLTCVENIVVWVKGAVWASLIIVGASWAIFKLLIPFITKG